MHNWYNSACHSSWREIWAIAYGEAYDMTELDQIKLVKSGFTHHQHQLMARQDCYYIGGVSVTSRNPGSDWDASHEHVLIVEPTKNFNKNNRAEHNYIKSGKVQLVLVLKVLANTPLAKTRADDKI